MLDDLAHYNRERWEALARANVEYSRPMLDLDPDQAGQLVDPEGVAGDMDGKRVLCLAGGGGQQSAAFALLGARVTVLDLCDTQLQRDREAAAHYGTEVRTIQGDMRDLSALVADCFDIVWHAHSLNFVPDPNQVFGEVCRVLRPGGLYRLTCTNPFIHGTWEGSWDGNGYALNRPYVDGEVLDDDPYWEFDDGDGACHRIRGPREFRHTLSALINGLIRNGLTILGFWEDCKGDANAAPGSWQHFKTVCAPWIILWALRPSP